jgi:integrase
VPRVRRRNPENLPPRVYKKHGAYYYLTLANKWLHLGRAWDLPARTRWAELAGESPPEGTVAELLSEYEKRMVPKKAPRTQVSNLEELKRIRAVFGRMLVRDLKLRHAAQYLEARAAKVRANREMALFGHAIRWGMNVGLCEFERHPFDGLMYNKEKPRDRHVGDDELERFLVFARGKCPVVAALLRTMYVMAQRRVDLLELRLGALLPDGIEVIQSKTGAKLLIEWSEELRACIDEARALRPHFVGMYLFCTRQGSPYSDSGIKAMFARTMRAALDASHGPPVLTLRFRMQDVRPKAATDVGGGKRAKDLLGHKTQATTDRVYDRATFKRVKPTK